MIACVFMVAAFAGALIAADEGDAEDASYSVAYKVGDRLYTVPSTSATITLKTIDELGASASIPAHKAFVEWYTSDDDGVTEKNKYAAGSTLILDTTTITIYASIDWITYTATFEDADGRIIGKPITGTMETGKQVNLAKSAPAAPAVEGMIFAGWLADDADLPVAKADLGTLNADVTYTAVYTIDYAVTFIDGDKTYISSVSDLTVPDLGERTGFNFLGWFVEIDGEFIQVDPESYPILEDTTFTAKWEPVNVYVTFEAGSFSTVVAVLYGQAVVEPALPSGYVGWGTKAADGTVTAFDFSKAITEDMTIVGIAAAPAKATGLSDPITMTLAIIIGTLVLVIIAVFVMMLRKGKIVIGRGPNAKKSSEEEKKE